MKDLRQLYLELCEVGKKDLTLEFVTRSLSNLAASSLDSLSHLPKVDLDSKIPGKNYFVFENKTLSRPINADLFDADLAMNSIPSFINFDWTSMGADIQKVLYTLAMSYCAATDVLGRSDKKTPSIYFEYFIGNLFARTYNVRPISQVIVDIGDVKTSLPTDYLFEPPGQHIRIHLPIKLSTRERSIQAWAHQRVLEGIYGSGRFRGVMVVMAETNYVSKDNSVVEVCLPDQWRLYQLYISKMSRIYYLDLPDKYAALPDTFPNIQVKPLSEFFTESAHLISHKHL